MTDRLVEEARRHHANGWEPSWEESLALADALEAAERENERLLRECEAWEIAGQEETFAREAAERRVDELREALDEVHNDLRAGYHHGGLSAEACKSMAAWVKQRIVAERDSTEARRVVGLREASDGLLGCIVEGPDGELALVPNSRQEVDRLRAALVERDSTEGER